MRPILSYIIWMTPRTGSTNLCKGLELTGIAGKPNEHFNKPDDVSFLDQYQLSNWKEWQEKLWQLGTSPNGVFSAKLSLYQPLYEQINDAFAKCSASKNRNVSEWELWENIFPNCKHIFLTRRNKAAQAVSWWKAIQSEEWHRTKGKNIPYNTNDIEHKYDFDALKHLILEAAARECLLQDFFTANGIQPLTIVYEDYIQDYKNTIDKIIDFLDVEYQSYTIADPYFSKIADELSETWLQRFRKELQQDWDKQTW